MNEPILKIQIEKIEGGSYHDSIECTGCQVEVLGMIKKARVILDKIESSVISEIKVKGVDA